MVEYADKMLTEWAAWRDNRVRLLGYPSTAAFAQQGARGPRQAPDVKLHCARVESAVQVLLDRDVVRGSVVLAHYLATASSVAMRCQLIGCSRTRYYELLDEAQRLVLRYVAEAKRFQG